MKKSQWKTLIKNDDFIVRDHRVHEVRVMPGVTLIDVVYRVLLSLGHSMDTIVLKRIVFSEPIATSQDSDRQIRIQTSTDEKENKLTIESQKWKDGQEVDGLWAENFRCEWSIDLRPNPEKIDLKDLMTRASSKQDLDSIYSQARDRGIVHYEFMKGLGEIYWLDNEMLCEIRLGSLASQYSDNFILHPVFLDSSTLFPLSFQMMELQTQAPYIPIYIGEFRALQRLENPLFVHVKAHTNRIENSDVIKTSYRLFDKTGNAVVWFEDFSAKQIRTRSSIEKLVHKEEKVSIEKTMTRTKNETRSFHPINRLNQIMDELKFIFADIIGKTQEEMQIDRGFYDLGFESSHLMSAVSILESKMKKELYPTLLFEHTTIQELALYLEENGYPTNEISEDDQKSTPPSVDSEKSEFSFEEIISRLLEKVTGKPSEQWNPTLGFYDQGVDSSQLMNMVKLLEEEVAQPLYPTLLFEYTTIRDLAQYLEREGFVSPKKAIPKKAEISSFSFEENDLIYFRESFEALPLSHRDSLTSVKTVLLVAENTDSQDLKSIRKALAPIKVLERVGSEVPDAVLIWGFPSFRFDPAQEIEMSIRSSFETLLSTYQELLRLDKDSRSRIVFLHAHWNTSDSYQKALSASLKTLRLETPRWSFKSVEWDEETLNLSDDRIFSFLKDEIENDYSNTNVYYRQGVRYVQRYELDDFRERPLACQWDWKKDATYLVFGGGGSLGFQVAEWIQEQSGANVVRIGRSKFPKNASENSKIFYKTCDASKELDVRNLFAELKKEFPTVRGMIFANGLVRDSLALQKKPEEYREVLQAKIHALVQVDRAWGNNDLDFFISFGSTSGWFGNIGQVDYAFANSFVHHFTVERAKSVVNGNRHGLSACISWPYWKDGGMKVEASILENVKKQYGLSPLDSKTGLEFLNQALHWPFSGALIFGNRQKLIEKFNLAEKARKINLPDSKIETAVINDPGNHLPRDEKEEFAIIGIDGRFPMAEDLEQFWNNLRNGVDGISEIPSDRWDHSSIYNSDRSSMGTSYGKWGGFISDVDRFDPLFFQISNREAEMLDPQERLFLEMAWNVFQDAGYTRKKLAKETVGVYAGVMWGQYQLFQRKVGDRHVTPGSFYASVANRVSYFFNLNGPSLSVDTMCSSSLTALSLACQSLQKGECTMALAGGVNLTLHPSKYVQLSQAQFFSTDGRCRSFGEGGDGYVPGEGVGAVLVKKLQKAIQDGDRIHAVVSACALNHGGRTSGFSVPHPQSQANVIDSAFRTSGWNPHSVSYIEAHGTGTHLGDPIEIAGLSKVFPEKKSLPNAVVSIGSVKSNIGHLEAAAGVAALAKVILQFRHRTLVPSLHSEKLNPAIAFEKTPFEVVQVLKPWKPGFLNDGRPAPLRAGISSFGAGGSNAHILIEEPPVRTWKKDLPSKIHNGGIFLLSAKDENRLRLYAKINASWFQNRREQGIDDSLSSICYTTQTAREPLEYRLALQCRSLIELENSLDDFSKAIDNPNVLGWGHTSAQIAQKKNSDPEQSPLDLARHWIEGGEVDWSLLYSEKVELAELPRYPFYRERCWVVEQGWMEEGSTTQVRPLHPLLDSNVSDLSTLKFEKTVQPNDRIVVDHQVLDRQLLPGSAYLEMALASLKFSDAAYQASLKDIFWLVPAQVDQKPLKLVARFDSSEKGLEYTVESLEEDLVKTHVKAHVDWTEEPIRAADENVDFSSIAERFPQIKTKEELSQIFASIGFRFGPSYNIMEEIRWGNQEAWAKLLLPETEVDGPFIAHPSLLDGAFRTIVGTLFDRPDSKRSISVPYSIDRFHVFKPWGRTCFAHARVRTNAENELFQTYDIDIYTPDGNLCGVVEGFNARPITNDALQDREIALESDIHHWIPQWCETPIAPTTGSQTKASNLLFFSPRSSNQREPVGHHSLFDQRGITVTLGSKTDLSSKDSWTIEGDEDDYNQILEKVSFPEDSLLTIVHAFSFEDNNATFDFAATDRVGVVALLKLLRAIERLARNRHIRLLVAYPARPSFQCFMGLAKSLSTIVPYVRISTFEFESMHRSNWISYLRNELNENSENRSVSAFRYSQGIRYKRDFQYISDSELKLSPSLLKQNGVYVIFGGAGGLGSIFAEALRQKYSARLVLAGRSALNTKIQDLLSKLGDSTKTQYIRADVTQYSQVENIVQETLRNWGTIDGILFCAGDSKGQLWSQSELSDWVSSMDAKRLGAVHVDRATAKLNLDFVAFFSSIASTLGDFGVGSYSIANSFLDEFAQERSEKVKKGERHGASLSIEWPYWKSQGMELSAELKTMYLDYSGLRMLTSQSGWNAFISVLERQDPVTIILPGSFPSAERALGQESTLPEKEIVADPILERNESTTHSSPSHGLIERLQQLFSQVLKIPVSRIEPHQSFDQFGMDSVLAMEIGKKLESEFGTISKTLLFERRTILAVAQYLEEQYPLISTDKRSVVNVDSEKTPVAHSRMENGGQVSNQASKIRSLGRLLPQAPDREVPIAIIGLAGEYPGTESLADFWLKLREGFDAVTEVPEQRWPISPTWDSKPGTPNKTYSKWGSFLEGYSDFDPLFFDIPPVMAKTINPQERLFLQTAWSALEDAGYTKESLQEEIENERVASLGVFVGVMWNDYLLYGGSSDHSSIANRVSYVLNAQGPSLAIDTACSSSLVALHYACEHLRKNEIRYAIAGGVNLSMHPSKYIGLSSIHALSPTGKCRAFGKDADGYVPGEGVGAVLLKRLDDALKDGDSIYAVIKGSSVNHGGRTNGYTVPNPQAQERVIRQALKAAKIAPETIGYIETHGTGTSLGDPIEITGLNGAFRGAQFPQSLCRIGSIKSNWGHLEAAAGIASLTKVVFQIKHREFVPSLHCQELNPLIEWGKTPFRVQSILEPWDNPLSVSKTNKKLPRRSGISAFGAGGTNAHVVVEEFVPDSKELTLEEKGGLFVLSAKTPERLKAYVEKLLAELKLKNSQFSQEWRSTRLQDIVYTFQVGRKAFEERLAVYVTSKEELIYQLENFLQGNNFSGVVATVVRESDGHRLTTSDTSDLEYLRSIVRKNEWAKFAKIWATGSSIEWEKILETSDARRISLPTYPFQRQKYWLKPLETVAVDRSSFVHPFLQKNESTLVRQRYVSRFAGSDFVFADHIISGTPIFPAAAYLEMVTAAARIGMETSSLEIRNAYWSEPLSLDADQALLQVEIEPFGEAVNWVVSTSFNGEQKIHATGQVGQVSGNRPNAVSVRPLIDQSTIVRTQDQIYTVLKERGFGYGPSFRTISHLYCQETYAVSELNLNQSELSKSADFILHPGLLDGAFQTALGILKWTSQDSGKLMVPVGIEAYCVYVPNCHPRFAVARIAENQNEQNDIIRYDIDLLDSDGNVLAQVRSLTVRVLKTSSRETESSLTLVPSWKDEAFDEQTVDLDSIAVFSRVPSQMAHEWEVQLRKACRPQTRIETLPLTANSQTTASHWIYLFERAPSTPEDFTPLLWLAKAASLASRKIELTIFVLQTEVDNDAQGLWSFALSVGASVSKLSVQIVSCDTALDVNWAQNAVKEIAQRQFSSGSWIQVKNGLRRRRAILPLSQPFSGKSLLRPRGTYWITGGAGGLGIITARWLVQNFQARVLLTGRSEWSEKIEDLLRSQIIEKVSPDSEVKYLSTDVNSVEAVEEAVQWIESHWGTLNGIFHIAGHATETPIDRVTEEGFQESLATKVSGTRILDQAWGNRNLDLFVVYSSLSTLLGDYGACSYAISNSELDRFSVERNLQVEERSRCGKTLSIVWPLWKDGGIQLPEDAVQYYWESTGARVLDEAVGTKLLEATLVEDALTPCIVMHGAVEKISRLLKAVGAPKLPLRKPPHTIESTVVPSDSSNLDLFGKTVEYLKMQMSTATQIPLETLDPKKEFEHFGIDSIVIMELNKLLEKDFSNLPKTLFFEYKTIHDLAGFLVAQRRPKLDELFPDVPTLKSEEHSNVVPMPRQNLASWWDKKENTSIHSFQENEKNSRKSRGVAIIGMAGQYPQAADLDVFWENLKLGRDSIVEIPADRWDYRIHYEAGPRKMGKTYSKWGGFLDGVDRFDPLFFRISPREAEWTDPQERLFLQTAWKTIEDAGYTRQQLAKTSVGVFVGVMWANYQLIGADLAARGQGIAPNCLYSSIPNRVSYVFDLKGPSLAVDTMCSSSLVSLHLAAESIRNGECSMALAGGVNVCAHPNKYLQLSQGNFLSTDGRCRGFGNGGDGYVPGEGVGAVLLKDLDQALHDGDHIYGIIKSSAVNHGGRTNNFSVPNPVGQSQVIERALRNGGIDPNDVSYIEAHGTGTSLGDPIEISGLERAFASRTTQKKISVGTVKSNVGHLESAAGIASLTKVILQMKHKTLVPSLHTETLNPNIDFENSRFRVQKTTQAWTGNDPAKPLIAGISAFGAGGTNVHVVVEEFDPHLIRAGARNFPSKVIPIFVLSAKNKERLYEYAQNIYRMLSSVWSNSAKPSRSNLKASIAEFLGLQEHEISSNERWVDLGFDATTLHRWFDSWCEKSGDRSSHIPELETAWADWGLDAQTVPPSSTKSQLSFESVLFTLQTGREAFEYRTAFEVKDEQDLLRKLASYLGNKTLPDSISGGDETSEEQALVRRWISKTEIDWEKEYSGRSFPKVSLPTYPFAQEQYWVPDLTKFGQEPPKVREYRKTLNGKSPFLKDHVVGNQILVPGTFYLDFVTEAAKIMRLGFVDRIEDWVWQNPLSLKEEDSIDLISQWEGLGQNWNVKIYAGESQSVLCSGKVYTKGVLQGQAPFIDPAEWERKIESSIEHWQQEQVYTVLSSLGFRYGPTYQVTKELYGLPGSAFGVLNPPHHVPDYGSTLHPSLLDASLRASIIIPELRSAKVEGIPVPFSISKIHVFKPLNQACRVMSRISNQDESSRSFDIDLVDESGIVIVRIEKFTVRWLKPKNYDSIESRTLEASTSSELLTFCRVWKSPQEKEGASSWANVVVCTVDTQLVAGFKEWTNQVQLNGFTIQSSKKTTVFELDNAFLRPKNAEDWEKLWNEMDLKKIAVDTLIFDADFGQNSRKKDEWDFLEPFHAFYRSLQGLWKSKPLQIWILGSYDERTSSTNPAVSAFSGLANSLAASNPKHRVRYIEVSKRTSGIDRLNAVFQESKLKPPHLGTKVRWDGMERSVECFDLTSAEEHPSVRKGEETVLVTGALGGIGRLLCKRLVDRGVKNLILTSRRSLNEESEKWIESMRQSGIHVEYRSIDLAKEADVAAWVTHWKIQYPVVDAVYHIAGLEGKTPFASSDGSDLKNVISPKVGGLKNIYSALSDSQVKRWILFSSISAYWGDFGAGAYGFANEYLNSFAENASLLDRSNSKVVSIAWPYWEKGGIELPAQALEVYEMMNGMKPLPTEMAWSALDQVLQSNESNWFVAYGDRKRILERVVGSGTQNQVKPKILPEIHSSSSSPIEVNSDLGSHQRGLVVQTLKKILSELIKIESERIDESVPITDYGVDSVTMMDFGSRLTESFGDLPRTLLFEYSTVGALADYLCHAEKISDSNVAAKNENPSSTSIVPLSREENSPTVEGTRLVRTKRGSVIEALTEGQGEDLIFLPGIGFGSPIWQAQVKTLSQSFRVTVLHLPGHGKSHCDQKLTFDEVCSELLEATDLLELSPKAHWIATSMGGLFAQRASILFPHRVLTLTLAVSFSQLPEGFKLVKLDELIEQEFINVHPERRQDFESILRSSYILNMDFVGYYGKLLWENSNKGRLGEIQCPTLVVSADQDTVVSSDESQWILEHVPHAQGVRIEGSGHFVYLTQSQKFNDAVVSFLSIKNRSTEKSRS